MMGNALLAQACLAEVGVAKEQSWWGCVKGLYDFRLLSGGHTVSSAYPL